MVVTPTESPRSGGPVSRLPRQTVPGRCGGQPSRTPSGLEPFGYLVIGQGPNFRPASVCGSLLGVGTLLAR